MPVVELPFLSTPRTVSSPPPAGHVSGQYWRSLHFFNFFRLIIVNLLLVLAFMPHGIDFQDSFSRGWFMVVCQVYFLAGLVFLVAIRARRPRFAWQLSAQVGLDVLFVVSVMHLTGGVRGGFGTLLLPYLAAAGLISRGRMTLFHAAMATVALLLMQIWHWLEYAPSSEFVQTGLLSTACFATAWLAFRLAQFAREKEALAEARGVDLANLAQVNQLVLSAMPDAVLVVDAQGLIRQANRRAEQLLQPHMLQQPLHTVSPWLLAHWQQWCADKREAPVSMLEHGQPWRPRFVPITVNGVAGGTVIFLEDMLQEQALAQQIKLAALGRLTANIAHEIRNPLAAVQHAAELLAEEQGDPATRRLTAIIRDNTARLEKMVRDVLELNRRDRVQPVTLVLSEWMATFVEDMKATHQLTHPTLQASGPAGVSLVFDPAHLQQIMWNLCQNACRYARDRVDIDWQIMDETVVIRVHDDGAGIPAEVRAHLFEPFYTTNSRGTGLGLYIARELAAANAAVLICTEDQPGTTFALQAAGYANESPHE
jgi:two-component system sensor histidine kinase PilS (NtrC family)